MTVCLWTAARLGLVDKAKAYFAEGREEDVNSQDKRGERGMGPHGSQGLKETMLNI